MALDLPEPTPGLAPAAGLVVEMYRGPALAAKQKTPVAASSSHPIFGQEFAFNVSRANTDVRFVISVTDGPAMTVIGRTGVDIATATRGNYDSCLCSSFCLFFFFFFFFLNPKLLINKTRARRFIFGCSLHPCCRPVGLVLSV